MASQNVKNPEFKPQDVQRAQIKLTELVRANRKKKLHLETLQAEYAALIAKLETLPQKFSHQIMVPFAGVAFMPGQIQHTNEITVLLGDNWFMQCTASHAAEIAQRRQKRVEKTMAELDSEFDLVKGSLGLTNELNLGTTKTEEGFIEIREFEDDDDSGSSSNSLLKGNTLKLPSSSNTTTATATATGGAAAPMIQVISSTDLNQVESDLFHRRHAHQEEEYDDEDNYEDEDDDSETFYDDFDDEEIEASLALAARTTPTEPSSTTKLPTIKPSAAKSTAANSSSPQNSTATSKTVASSSHAVALPQIVSSSSNRPSQQVQRTVIPPSVSQAAATLPKVATKPKPNVSSAPQLPTVKKSSVIVVEERDVVAAPLAPALGSQQAERTGPIVVEEEPKRVSRFKQMQMRGGK